MAVLVGEDGSEVLACSNLCASQVHSFEVLPKHGETGDSLLPLCLLLTCGLRPHAGLCYLLLQPRLAEAMHAYK